MTAQIDKQIIKLDQFLKLAQVVATGGQAKTLIYAGRIKVNQEVETRRGRKLRPGDVVEVDGEVLVVQWEEPEVNDQRSMINDHSTGFSQ